MRTPVRALVLAVVVLISIPAGFSFADGFRSRWWHTPEYAQALNLTEDEIQRLDTLYEAARIKMIEIKGKVEVERAKLRVLMEQKDVDRAAVMAQHRSQEEARTQLSEERFKFLLEIRDLVGYDRFIKLLEVQDERRQRRKDRWKSKSSEQQP